MADVFRTQTCVMVTSPGAGTSHPNMLPLGQRRGINGGEGEVAEGDEVAKVQSELQGRPESEYFKGDLGNATAQEAETK